MDSEQPLSTLDLNNNPFKEGTWYYDSTTKEIYINGAMDGATTKEANYILSGSATEIKKDKVITTKVTGVNYTNVSLTSKFSLGYLTGLQINNYVELKVNNTLTKFRVVKVNEDGSILIIANASIGNKEYGGNSNDCYANEGAVWTGNCKNNFAVSYIKEYLNNDFYNIITNKGLIKNNIWDTRLENGMGVPSTTIAKIGLLSLDDYSIISSNNTITTNYLYIDDQWWLSTGSSSFDSACSISSGISDCGFTIDNQYAVRPAIVLNKGINLTCKYGNGTDECNGTSEKPYKIE